MIMTPKMPKDLPQKMVVPQARIPMMQTLRDGGGTMKVFGDRNVPMMHDCEKGGYKNMKK